jgi:hypothetical protein
LFPNIVKPKNPKSCYPTKIWTKPKHWSCRFQVGHHINVSTKSKRRKRLRTHLKSSTSYLQQLAEGCIL